MSSKYHWLNQELGAMLQVVLVLVFVKQSSQVPASPIERFWEELANVKTMITAVSNELERFNTLYLGKLETRMITMASLLSSLDSNVKNLQERAHVWDTFQLHVSAWNEQINTLDKKVDILSRGQEKMVSMDSKVSSLVNLDYKVERLVRKMDDADNKLAVITKALDHHRDDSLFGDFTNRGVLGTLKNIERKVDHIEGSVSQSAHGKASKNCGGKRNDSGLSDSIEGGEEATVGNGKLVIKCNTPVIVEELLRDVASKVDVIFDKMGENDYSELRNNEQLSDEQVALADSADESELFDRLLKRMSAPNKKTARTLESIEKTLSYVHNSTTVLWKDQTLLLDQILSCCTKSDETLHQLTNTVDSSLRKLDHSVTSRAVTGVTLARQFHEQTSYLEGVIKNHGSAGACPASRGEPAPTAPPVPAPSPFPEDDDEGTVTQSSGLEVDVAAPVHTSCEKLAGTRLASGVYKVGQPEPSSTRYCETGVDGGGWTVIQRRGNFAGRRQEFSLPWNSYRHGFGNLQQEFWIGNDVLHLMTTEQNYTLRIDLEDFEGNTAWAHYTTFKVGPESDGYRLRVAGYSGNATDSFSAHDGSAFSTLDRKNDVAPECCPCVAAYGGGWWFYSCFEANLNAEYYTPDQSREHYRGLIWENWLGNVSLKRSRMMIRPRDFVAPSVEGASEEGRLGKDEDFEVDIPTPKQEDVDPLDVPEDP